MTGGHTDDLVRAAEGSPEERPLLDPGGSGNVEGLERTGSGEKHAGTGLHRGVVDSATHETRLGRLDGVVSHPNLGGMRLANQVDQRAQDLGVGGGAQRGGAVEGHVGFDDHHVASLDESTDASNQTHGGPDQGLGIVATSHTQGGGGSHHGNGVAVFGKTQPVYLGLPPFSVGIAEGKGPVRGGQGRPAGPGGERGQDPRLFDERPSFQVLVFVVIVLIAGLGWSGGGRSSCITQYAVPLGHCDHGLTE